jgi:hypothetical protein
LFVFVGYGDRPRAGWALRTKRRPDARRVRSDRLPDAPTFIPERLDQNPQGPASMMVVPSPVQFRSGRGNGSGPPTAGLTRLDEGRRALKRTQPNPNDCGSDEGKIDDVDC